MCDDLSVWEEDAIAALEATFEQVARRRDLEAQQSLIRLEKGFREAALAIAQLYSNQSRENYQAFRTAACKLTDFYKESKDSFNSVREKSKELGRVQRDQESVKWLRTRRRMIRREEMLGKMANRSPPPLLPPPGVPPLERQKTCLAKRNRNSPQRRSPRPGPSSQPCIHRCNTNCNKELSNIQNTLDDFSVSSPPRTEKVSRKRALQLFDDAVYEHKRQKINEFSAYPHHEPPNDDF
ncbi:Oidioi.mRNA.OKI2018_I69.chr1.g3259.t1.cds [Oikopleura dioica]|uniref:Oidioi.mRNA.OKI2018_I69.chr1.g3259.t1.cds n=1 Tax=Oikopleura dioica TaxID=34765 RepID=A0ABN7SU76_OIKDI|nr:Oidioi.mRNA.OKI2018_I69.chr1.g3259.t1.cds [Oikopleura dioica]